MAVAKQFQQLVKITNGTTAETDVKLSDPLAMQHIDITSGANSLNQISLAQSMCQPVAVTPNSTPSGGAYTATCSNYPDFSLTYTDKNGNTHYLVGIKVRVIFTKGITYGSVSGGTYPTLNINSSGAIPLLAQGKTMAAGAAVDGQSLELTLIPYGNGVAWDADSNVRESTSDYTIYTDGLKRVDVAENNNKNMITSNAVYNGLSNKASTQVQNTNMAYLNSNSNKYLVITRTEGITVSYFRTMSFLIVDDTGTHISILSFGRRESDIAVLTNLAGNLYLTVKASNSDTVVLETSASLNKLYTIYGLTGYKPTIYASTTNPLA